jgi:hypothetical protein
MASLLAAALLPAALFASAPPATANTPRSPGTPSAPTVLFDEDFENGPATIPTVLNAYTGGAPLDETYTADPAWVNTAACNGYIVSAQDPATPPSGCGDTGAWPLIQASVEDLGTWAGGDPATNHALTQFTDTDPGAGKVQLQTAQPIALPSAGRFLTVETDAAGENCFGNHQLYQFNLLDGSTAAPTSSAPIDPCANPGEIVPGPSDVDVYVGTYTGDLAVLSDNTSVGIQLINEQASGYGNDGALDNIRLLDVTPQLDLSGTTGAVPVGAPANLTFTVTNTSELDAKNGWSFTADLPTGLTLANNTVSTTCASGAATAGSATGTINVGGDLTAGQSSCTVTVQVTSILGGNYQLCAAQVTNLVGLDPPGCATLAFTAPIFDARSDSALLTSPALDLGPLAPSAYECTSAPGTTGDSVASAGLGALGSLGTLTTAASGTIAANGTRTAAASATTAKVSLLAGLVTADAVTTTAQAQQPLTTSGPGTVTVSGSTTLTNLRIAGVLITADPGPNTIVNLPLVGSVVLNQQKTIAGGDGITVNALDVTLLTGAQLTIATSTSALLNTSQTCPVG